MTESQPPHSGQKSVEEQERLNIKVLLADDTPIVLDLSKDILEVMGCTVETVVDGQELLNKLFASKPEEFSLVITDKQMPVIGGREALNKIRANERFKKLPIILYSGALTSEDETAVQELGGLCLKKPFQISDFKEKVRRAVNGPKP